MFQKLLCILGIHEWETISMWGDFCGYDWREVKCKVCKKVEEWTPLNIKNVFKGGK